jgi:hypothetical protein
VHRSQRQHRVCVGDSRWQLVFDATDHIQFLPQPLANSSGNVVFPNGRNEGVTYVPMEWAFGRSCNRHRV